MPDWEKLNRELDQALSEMSDEDWKEWYSKRNKKHMKTAVEWLLSELHIRLLKINSEPDGIVRETMINNFLIDTEQAKEMEKEQMCKFAYKCHNHYKVYGDFKIEEYYNKTFKSE